MTRELPTWTVAPCAAGAFLVPLFVAGFGVIESITVAGFATIAWTIARSVSRAIGE